MAELEKRLQSAPASGAEDRRLVQRTLKGDPAALELLVRRLQCVPRILSVLNARFRANLGRDELADLTQDSLVAIWSKIRTFEGRARLETWVFRFCLIEVLRRIRSQGRLAKVELTDRLDAHEGPALTQLPMIALEIEEMEHHLDELGPPAAPIIRLKHFEDRTFGEIGRDLGISPNTAKTHYYRGIAWLRRRLKRLRGEDGA